MSKEKKEKPIVSKIEITLIDGEIKDFTNDSDIPMYLMNQDGFFMFSNYPLTIECNTCKGKGQTGLIKKEVCTECEGLGQIDLYQKKDD